MGRGAKAGCPRDEDQKCEVGEETGISFHTEGNIPVSVSVNKLRECQQRPGALWLSSQV